MEEGKSVANLVLETMKEKIDMETDFKEWKEEKNNKGQD